MSRLDDLRAKALAATQGDWHIKRDSEGGISIGHSLNKRLLAIVITMNGAKGVPQRDANADFIVAFQPKTVLALLDLIEAKEKELAEANLGLKIANDTVVGLATKLAAERERASTLFDAIQHGDEAHRAWLKQAIDDHFAGRPVERPIGQGETEALRERAEGLRKALEEYEECALYDATMDGPAFKGWNRSALDRARKKTETRKALAATGRES